MNVVARLEEDSDLPTPHVNDMLGKSRKYKQWTCLVNRTRIIDKVIGQYGSGNVVVDTLIEGHHGYHPAIMALANYQYLEDSAKAMPKSHVIALHWDGGSYGGLNVNMGMASDISQNFAVYL